MSDRYALLEEIKSLIESTQPDVPADVRKRFWRIVRDIKKDPAPSSNEIQLAAKIRDVLFELSRGRTLALWPMLAVMFIAGIGLSVLPYLYLLSLPLNWFEFLSWTMNDWFLFLLRVLCIFLGVALFYPIGRLIGSWYTGIKVLGVCRDDYYEPTLKIDYVSFLSTPPPKRKWFFFLGGIWTFVTSVVYLCVGILLAFDLSALPIAILILAFETYVITSGAATWRRGEMGLFNRERKIEQAWKRRISGMES